MLVRDVMTRDVVTVSPDLALKTAAYLLAERGISGLPVVDATGTVVGVLSEQDLVEKAAGVARGSASGAIHRLLGGEEERRREQHVQAARVEEAMSTPAITISPDQPLGKAAELMARRHINRLPVVEAGSLVGIVTRADVVRSYLRGDEEIAAAIREEILVRILWLEPDAVDVAVHSGVVKLSGRLDRRSTAEVLERLVRRLDGVVAVHADLTWELDDDKLAPPPTDLVSPYGRI